MYSVFSSVSRHVFVLFLVGVVGCGNTASEPNTTQDHHQTMVRDLNRIRKSTSETHPYLGDHQLRDAQASLKRLSADIPAADHFRLLSMVGALEVRQGQNEEALVHLMQAYDMLPELPSKIQSAFTDSVLFSIALAYLRIAESENCVHCRNGASCLLPIAEAGLHTKQSGSRNAIKYLEMLLQRSPEHRSGRWLLNVASMTVGAWPDQVPEQWLIPPKAFKSQAEFPGFTNVAAGTGLDTLSLSGGTVVDDFDNDRYLDVMVSTWDPAGQLQFFHNDGDGSFSDQTLPAGLSGLFGGLNLIQADYDNDGDVDVFVLRGAWLGDQGRHPNSLLQNDGQGRFRDVTLATGLGTARFPTQTASWSDFDNDGDLDLYIGNECYPDQLFRNDDAGRAFVDVAAQAGIDNRLMTKGVVWGDYNNDRWPDVYVSNLDGSNKLYRNNRNGTFTDVAQSLGVGKPYASFPTWFWDFNNDGILDLYCASYNVTIADIAADYVGLPHNAEPDCLYLGSQTGAFQNVAAAQNLPRATQPMGSNFGDLDNDGFPDFYLGTGDVPLEALMANRLFRNEEGNSFSDVTTASGTGHLQKGHGVAFADLDNDGDQDLFVELGGALPGDGFTNALFENPGFGNHWIKIRLIGTRSNRSAIGARIRIVVEEDGRQRSIYKWVNSGGSFGANPLLQEIGIGKAQKIALLEVQWPTSNLSQTFNNVDIDQYLEITETEDTFRKLPCKTFRFQQIEPSASSSPSDEPSDQQQTRQSGTEAY